MVILPLKMRKFSQVIFNHLADTLNVWEMSTVGKQYFEHLHFSYIFMKIEA